MHARVQKVQNERGREGDGCARKMEIMYLGSVEESTTASSGTAGWSVWSLPRRLSGPMLPLCWLSTSRSGSLSVRGRVPGVPELRLRREKASFRDLLMAFLPDLREGGRCCGEGVELGCRSDVCDMAGEQSRRGSPRSLEVAIATHEDVWDGTRLALARRAVPAVAVGCCGCSLRAARCHGGIGC
jgi:hypothetical protein